MKPFPPYRSVVLALPLLALLAGTPANAGKWSFQLEPYALGANIEGDIGIGRIEGVDVDIDTSDILATLELGGMLHFEAHHENGWGLFLDYAFMDLSDDLTGPRDGVLEADVFQGVLEAALVKRTGSGDRQLDYYVGVRWWNVEVDAELDPVLLPGTASRSVDHDWIAGIIGARWRNPIGEKWSFSLRGDVGAGAADFTWKAYTGFRYRIGNSTALDLGYVALGVDYETGTPGEPGYFMYDTITHGPEVGFLFEF